MSESEAKNPILEQLAQGPDEGAYSRYNQYGDNPMAPVGPIALVPLKGSVEFTDKVNWYLNKRRSEYQEQEFISKYPSLPVKVRPLSRVLSVVMTFSSSVM